MQEGYERRKERRTMGGFLPSHCRFQHLFDASSTDSLQESGKQGESDA